MSSLFNLDQYHLSPHLNRTQEQENIKNSADPHEKMEAEKEKDKNTPNVKREEEKYIKGYSNRNRKKQC